MADPMRLRDDPAFLDRTSERALRTVPVRRTSGSPAAPAPGPKARQARTTVNFPRPCDRCGRQDCTFSFKFEDCKRATCLRRVQSAESTVGRRPQKHRRNARDGRLHRPIPPGFPWGIRRRNRAPTPPPALNLPAPVRGSFPFTSRQLHVLLNSLFKVLFNFPSWYLSTIGLVHST